MSRRSDGQGSGIPAESEPENLAGLPQQRHFALYTGRWQDSLPRFRHRKDTDERVQGGIQIQKKLTLQTLHKGHARILIFLEGAQLTACPFYVCF